MDSRSQTPPAQQKSLHSLLETQLDRLADAIKETLDRVLDNYRNDEVIANCANFKALMMQLNKYKEIANKTKQAPISTDIGPATAPTAPTALEASPAPSAPLSFIDVRTIVQDSAQWPQLIRQIEDEIECRNVGMGLFQLIDEANDALSKNPPLHALASARIFQVIHLIKYGSPVIPHSTQDKLIAQINATITKRNNIVQDWEHPHGIIQHISSYADAIPTVATTVAVATAPSNKNNKSGQQSARSSQDVPAHQSQSSSSYPQSQPAPIQWRCKGCNMHWMDIIAQATMDVIAPARCPHCGATDIMSTNTNTNHQPTAHTTHAAIQQHTTTPIAQRQTPSPTKTSSCPINWTCGLWFTSR